MIETRWWWVRHAPVVPAFSGRIYGAQDVPCDLEDRLVRGRLERLAARLPAHGVWVSSALSRARMTATALHPAPPSPREFAAFDEQNFGLWQGRTWAEVEREDGARYDDFWADPANSPPPGGESFAAVIARVGGAIETLGASHGGGDIVAVAHGGVVRAAVAVALDLPAHKALMFAVDPLSVTRIVCFRDGSSPPSWRIDALNVYD